MAKRKTVDPKTVAQNEHTVSFNRFSDELPGKPLTDESDQFMA